MSGVSYLLTSCVLCITLSIKMPYFSYDTVPVFMHTCNSSGPWNDTTLKYFAKYPIITFEKGTGVNSTQEPYSSLYTEDKIIKACKQIKSIKPEIICIMYYNSMYDWPYYYLHEILASNPKYWLRDNNNRIVLHGGDKNFPQPEQGMLIPDYRQPEVQQLWASECINVTTQNYGIVDGCYMDKPQMNLNNLKGYNFTQQDMITFETGHNKSMALTQAAMNASNASFTITDHQFVPQGIIATMLLMLDKPNENNIELLMSFVERGILVEVYTSGCSDKDTFMSTLAAFLIGMGRYSYYACSSGWIWPDGWDIWYDEYDKPLGKPVSKGILKNGVYSRGFKSGTNVTFDTSTNTGKIDWAQ